MKVALGMKPHSGWAAAVVIGDRAGEPELVDRRRVELVAAADASWGRQPYHAAEHLEIAEARNLVRRGIAGARHQAAREMRSAMDRSRQDGHEVIACAVVVGEPMPDWTVDEILAVHFRMHQAEGALFRSVLLAAAEICGLKAVSVAEKELDERAEAVLMGRENVKKLIASLGKSAGPPWGKDQKQEALAALISLRSA